MRTDSDGRKWIENIPYDVWFDNPIAVANDSRPVGTGTAGSPGSVILPSGNHGKAGEPGTEPEAKSSKSIDWKAIVPAAVLDSEVKDIRNRMTQNLQTVGKYNGHYKEIEVDGTVLAAVGVIAHEHPDPLRWKEHALYLRDLGTAIADSSTGLGRKAFDATQASYEKVVGILNGSAPADMPDPDPNADLTFTVYRSGVMKRMDRAFKQMKDDVSDKQTLLAKRDDVLHEAGMLAALATLIQNPNYSSAGEQKYAEQARGLVKAGLDIGQSIEDANFDAYRDALNRIQKRCDECHADYRFGDKL